MSNNNSAISYSSFSSNIFLIFESSLAILSILTIIPIRTNATKHIAKSISIPPQSMITISLPSILACFRHFISLIQLWLSVLTTRVSEPHLAIIETISFCKFIKVIIIFSSLFTLSLLQERAVSYSVTSTNFLFLS